nr:CpaF/VirB11 family protein [Salmonella enterica]
MTLPNHPNHIHLFYKKGIVDAKSIIEACMRLKPDHIFLAELRGMKHGVILKLLTQGMKAQ